jgi:hypothetical protein
MLERKVNIQLLIDWEKHKPISVIWKKAYCSELIIP